MKVRLLVGVVCLLVLAGCTGGVRPGAAATVDGRTISMDQADEAAGIYCRLSLLQAEQQGVAELDNTAIRRQALSEIVLAEIAQDVAEREGITVAPGEFRLSAAERSQITQVLPGADPEAVVETLESSRLTFAVAEALGERETGETANETNADALQTAGRGVLAEELQAADVRFDPRFGLDGNGEQVALTGSLAASPADLEAPLPADQPATQRCA